MKHPEQNYLIVGPRGSGKTTLVTRLKYAIQDDADLNTWLLPVLLSEEQYHINRLVDLWETIAEVLEHEYGFTDLISSFQKHFGQPNEEQKCFNELLNALKKNKKKIVLFIENIGDFLGKIDDLQVKRIREILIHNAELRIIATSSVILESIFDYQYPFILFKNFLWNTNCSNSKIYSF